MQQQRWIQITGQLTRAQIEENQLLGLMPPQNDVAAYADRGHFDVSRHGWREDGSGTKLWAYTRPAPFNFHVAISGTLASADARSYSDQMWSIYGPAAQQIAGLYRQFKSVIPVFPRLIMAVVDEQEAARLNVADGQTSPYPLGTHTEGGIASFPPYVLRFRPGGNNLIVEAMQFEQFSAWAGAQAAASSGATLRPKIKVSSDVFRASVGAALFAGGTADEFAARVLTMVEVS